MVWFNGSLCLSWCIESYRLLKVPCSFFYSLLSSSGTSWNRPFASSTKPWWRVRTPSSPGKSPSTRSSPEWTTPCPTTSSPPTFWTRWSDGGGTYERRAFNSPAETVVLLWWTQPPVGILPLGHILWWTLKFSKIYRTQPPINPRTKEVSFCQMPVLTLRTHSVAGFFSEINCKYWT